MSYDDFPIEDPELFAKGRAFGEEHLQRYFERLKNVSHTDTADLTEFIYPALAVEVLGMMNLVRMSFDRETALNWFSHFLDFLSDTMTKNQMKARIESEVIALEDDEKPPEDSAL